MKRIREANFHLDTHRPFPLETQKSAEIRVRADKQLLFENVFFTLEAMGILLSQTLLESPGLSLALPTSPSLSLTPSLRLWSITSESDAMLLREEAKTFEWIKTFKLYQIWKKYV